MAKKIFSYFSLSKIEWQKVLCFCTPIFLFMIYDRFLLKRPYIVGTGDGAEGYFAFALNWLSLDPLRNFHHPGFFFQQLAALTFAIIGLPNKDLELFTVTGIIWNMITTIICSVWLVKITGKLNITKPQLIGISLAFISMPVMLGVVNNWHIFYILALLATTATVKLFSAVINEKNNYRDFYIPLFILGFCIANYYGYLILLVSIMFALLIIFSLTDLAKMKEKFGTEQINHRFLGPTLILTIGLFSFSMLRSGFSEFNKLFLLGIFLMAGLFFYVPEKTLLLMKVLAAPLLTGWLVGTNFLFRIWFECLNLAMTYKGSAIGRETGMFANFYPYDFIKNYHWFWLVLAAGFFSFILLIACIVKKINGSKISQETLFVALMGTIGITLNIMASANVSLIPSPSKLFTDGQLFPVWIRYYLPFMPILPIVLLWIFRRHNAFGSHFALTAVIAVASCTVWKYHKLTLPAATNVRQMEAKIAQYFDQNPQGRLICIMEDATAKECLLAGAYSPTNVYRTASQQYRLKESPDGRIVYIYQGAEEIKRLTEIASNGHFLLVKGMDSNLPDVFPRTKEVFHSDDSTLRISLLQSE